MDILDVLREQLHEQASPLVAQRFQRFFKQPVNAMGLKSAAIEQIAKANYSLIKSESKEKVFTYCEELWKSEWLEEDFVACNWTYQRRKEYSIYDFQLFERWIDQYIKNWASCDTFCNHSVGSLLMMYPELMPELTRWAQSPNLWMRRAAAVSLIVPARKGMFLDEIFQLARILLLDKEDMVQKGYGWMLKVASQAHQDKVFDFVMEHQSVMPRTALRYAIEKMPQHMREEAMRK